MPDRADLSLPKGDALSVVMNLTQTTAAGAEVAYDLTLVDAITFTASLDDDTDITYTEGSGITVTLPRTLGQITVRLDGDDFPTTDVFPWTLKVTPDGSNDTDTCLWGDLAVFDPQDRVQTVPSGGTCSPWATEADLCSPCNDYGGLSPAAGEMLQAASDVLFELSGGQFPGLCTRTVRPCARRSGQSDPPDWRPGWGVCGCADGCECDPHWAVELGAFPVVSVQAVKIDGVTLASSAYRVDDYRRLVRIGTVDGGNEGWPSYQRLDLPDSAVGTWSVRFTWGRPAPAAGVRAAAVLACEMAMACDPDNVGNCRLPKRVQTVVREGVTVVLQPAAFVDASGNTGLWEVDTFLAAYNPARARRPATVWHAGMARAPRRVGT